MASLSSLALSLSFGRGGGCGDLDGGCGGCWGGSGGGGRVCGLEGACDGCCC